MNFWQTNCIKVLYLQKNKSLAIIEKLRADCRSFSQKLYKIIAENFSRQPHIKRKSDIIQTSFFVLVVNQSAVKIPNRPLRLVDGFVKPQKVIPL